MQVTWDFSAMLAEEYTLSLHKGYSHRVYIYITTMFFSQIDVVFNFYKTHIWLHDFLIGGQSRTDIFN